MVLKAAVALLGPLCTKHVCVPTCVFMACSTRAQETLRGQWACRYQFCVPRYPHRALSIEGA